LVDTSQTPGPSNPALLPFSGVLERLAKAVHSHTATDLVSAAIGYS
jgi:hypothetical protein